MPLMFQSILRAKRANFFGFQGGEMRIDGGRTVMASSRPSRIGHIYGQSDTFMAQSDAKKFAAALRAAVFTTHFQKFLSGGTILQRNAVFLSL